jgi:hypothetical protein
MVAFTSMPFGNTIDTVRYVYSLYPEAAKLKVPRDGETILHCARGGSLENIRLAHATVQKNISVKSKSLLPLHSFVSNVARRVDVVGWLWRLCVSFSSIILLGWEAFKDFSSATTGTPYRHLNSVLE